jgi:uncharacterized protein (DUF2252 family)
VTMTTAKSARVTPRAPRDRAEAAVPHLTVTERIDRGKTARAEVPRSGHAVYEPTRDRADPIDLLESQAAARIPELVPIRYGRMLVSPFAFYRGAAKIMANDLAATPRSGLKVQCCGDAHLSNFGVFASPERRLVFDINDFDEALSGPWEWDVKRLAASMLIGARDNGLPVKDQDRIVLETVAQYRTAMRQFVGMQNLELWYQRLEIETLLKDHADDLKHGQVKRTEKTLAKARTRDSMTAFAKLTHTVDGEVRIVDESPLIVPIDVLASGARRDELIDRLRKLIRRYRETLEFDRRILLEEFRLVDLARKVVGVGSVGTRAWIALMLGRDSEDPLFLQIKEADASVLEEFLGPAEFKNHGERVVTGQRLMQASSDIFLGWLQRRYRPGRPAPRLLHPSAQGLEGFGGDREHDPERNRDLRQALWLDPRARPRPQRGPDRDRHLPRQERRLRPGDPGVLARIRRSERARLPSTRQGGRFRPGRRPNRTLTPR